MPNYIIRAEKNGMAFESYFNNGQLCSKGSFVNGEQHGLWESYFYNGQLIGKDFYL